MKKTAWVWIMLGTIVWVIIFLSIASSLIRHRAHASLNFLLQSDSFPISEKRANTDLSNIQDWLWVRWQINGLPAKANATDLASVFSVLRSLLLIRIPEQPIEPDFCQYCSAAFNTNLKAAKAEMLAMQGKVLEIQKLQALKSKLQNLRGAQIRLHALLAKDFAELLGSSSLYESKGLSQLLYFEQGPFKLLPKLDDSLGKEESTPTAVPNFSKRLEKLRADSSVIIEGYNALKAQSMKNNLDLRSKNDQRALALSKVRSKLLLALQAEQNL